MKEDVTFKLLEQSLLKNGLGYRVTLSSNVTVELIDKLTGVTLGVTTSKTLEESLTSVVAQVLGRNQPQQMLSRL